MLVVFWNPVLVFLFFSKNKKAMKQGDAYVPFQVHKAKITATVSNQ